MNPAGAAEPRAGVRRAGRGLTLAALAVLLASLGPAVAGRPGTGGWLYHLAWYPTLAALAGGLAWREGRWPVPGRRFLASLFLWSVPFWYFFELANFRLENWFYVSVVRADGLRWVGTALAFATVLPALYLGYRWARSLGLGASWRRPAFEVGPLHRWGLTSCGALFLVLALWRPDAFFPLVWGALTLLVEPWNHRQDASSSLLGQLSRGRYAGLVQLLAGGLFIGLLWEAYNYPAGAKWIYTVPGMEVVKWFEMPPPGFLGFPVLALDGYVVYRCLVHLGVAAPGWRVDGGAAGVATGRGAGDAFAAAGDRGGAAGEPEQRLRRRRTLAAGALAAVFCLGVQWGVDRWTVASLAPRLEELPLEPAAVRDLRGAGVREVGRLARMDPSALAAGPGLSTEEAEAAVRSARLASLRGLGSRNAALLWESGIRSPCRLAGSDPGEVARVLRPAWPGEVYRTKARARVWIRAAAGRCRREGGGAGAGATGTDGGGANREEGRP